MTFDPLVHGSWNTNLRLHVLHKACLVIQANTMKLCKPCTSSLCFA